MRLTSLCASFFTAVLAGFVSAQQTVTTNTGSSAIISQYGSTFKNAGGSVLHDKVNSRKKHLFES
jgi:hypothetical protein